MSAHDGIDLIPELPPLDVAADDHGPRREWLLRCYDADRSVATCSIEANAGTITIVSPRAGEMIALDRTDIAAFQEALRAAITRANADYADGRYRCCA